MKKDVIISIHSTQEYVDCQPDEISLITKGALYEKNGKYYIKYEESELYENKTTYTTLKVEKNSVTMIRNGENPTNMFFKENEHHIGLYNTIAGSYTLGIKTHKIRNEINENGGILEFDYDVELNYQLSGKNTFKIIVKKED